MSTATACPELVSAGELARRFGVSEHKIRVVLDRLRFGRVVGRYRVVAVDDLGTVEMALVAAGYLDRSPAGETGLDPRSTLSGRSRQGVIEGRVAGPAMQNPTGLPSGGASLNPLGGPLSRGAVDDRPTRENDRRGNDTP